MVGLFQTEIQIYPIVFSTKPRTTSKFIRFPTKPVAHTGFLEVPIYGIITFPKHGNPCAFSKYKAIEKIR